MASGVVGECLQLVPDGRKLDLFEAPFGGDGFLHAKTDLWVDDAIPLAFTRVTGPLTDWEKQTQNEIRNVYNLYLHGDRFPYTYAVWVLPDDQSIQYDRISRGKLFADAVFEHWNPMPVFGGSRMAWNGDGWDVSLQNGMTYLSPEAYYAKRPQQGSLVGIFDPEGREVRVLRETNGDLKEIRSPAGHWIRFAYDNKGRMGEVADSAGRNVRYAYDSEDRLSEVLSSDGEVTRYEYDGSNRIIGVQDSSRSIDLRNEYDSDGDVTEQTLNGQTYRFLYNLDLSSRSAQITITGPNKNTAAVKISATKGRLHYEIEKNDSAPVRR